MQRKDPETPGKNEKIISLRTQQNHQCSNKEADAKSETGVQQLCREEASDPDAFATEAGELTNSEEGRIVEALLFAADSPLSDSKLNELAGLGSSKKARKLASELRERYEKEKKPYMLQKLAGGYQLRTRAEFEPWVSKLHRKQKQDTLSQAALETLSIIAYRQPITRAAIEDIRGVQSGYIIRSLIEKSLVRVTGRSDQLGRPLLYGTTNTFLEVFGLDSLNDLPSLDIPQKSELTTRNPDSKT